MRKIYFLFFVWLIASNIGFAQVNYGDFETITPGFGTFGGATYEVVENPLSDGINTSAHVAKTVTSGETWDGMWVSLGGTIDFTSSTIFTLKVYADVAGTVLWKLEKDDDANVFKEVSAEYTQAGSWEELSFDFTDAESDLYGKFVLFFDFNNTVEGDNWYFDDLQGPNFTPGANVNATFTVTDILGVSDIKIELDNNGTQIQMYDDGTHGDATASDFVWFAQVDSLTGSTILNPEAGLHAWDIIADGTVADGADDIPASIQAGQGTATFSYTLAPSQPENGDAVSFDSLGLGAPVIDGVIDDVWENATKFTLLKNFNQETFDNLADMNAYWKAGWDANGLYILVHITADDVHFTDGSYGAAWEQDIIEVYLDMNWNDLYDGVGAGAGYTTGHYLLGFHTEPDITMPDWAYGSTRGIVVNDDNTVVQELFVDWLDIVDKDGNVFVPNGETAIGFDVYVSDNDGPDNGAARNRKVWKNDGSIVGENWGNMDEAGLLRCRASGTGVQQLNKQINFQVYPNPVNSELFLTGLPSNAEIIICDITGKSLKTIYGNNSSLSINLKDFTKGMYFVSVKHQNTNNTLKFIKY